MMSDWLILNEPKEFPTTRQEVRRWPSPDLQTLLVLFQTRSGVPVITCPEFNHSSFWWTLVEADDDWPLSCCTCLCPCRILSNQRSPSPTCLAPHSPPRPPPPRQCPCRCRRAPPPGSPPPPMGQCWRHQLVLYFLVASPWCQVRHSFLSPVSLSAIAWSCLSYSITHDVTVYCLCHRSFINELLKRVHSGHIWHLLLFLVGIIWTAGWSRAVVVK